MKIKYVLLGIFSILFILGIVIILKSDSWNLGSIESMNLAGTIISIFSGIGILCELYLNKKLK